MRSEVSGLQATVSRLNTENAGLARQMNKKVNSRIAGGGEKRSGSQWGSVPKR